MSCSSPSRRHTGIKCTALFPTNPEKRKPAEMGFRPSPSATTAADGDTYTTNGPLFEWRLIGLTAGERNEPLVGVTAAGWALLTRVAGDLGRGTPPWRPPPRRSSPTSPSRHRRTGRASPRSSVPSDPRARPDRTSSTTSPGRGPTGPRTRSPRTPPATSPGPASGASSNPSRPRSQYHLTPLGHEHTNGAEQ